MEVLTLETASFDNIIFLLKSYNYLEIYMSMDKIIRYNYNFNNKETNDKEYVKLLNFYKELIILKKIDLVKEGLATIYDINEDIYILTDLIPTVLKSELLKEYYEMITEYNCTKYGNQFIEKDLMESLDNIFVFY